PVAVDGDVDETLGDLDFPVGVAGLALLVDAQADHGRPVPTSQPQHPVEPGAGPVAVFQVGGVQYRPSADPLQAGLHHLRFRRVEDDRGGDLGSETGGESIHVRHPVPTHVVHAEIDQVGGFTYLLPTDLDAGVPVFGQHGVTELAGAVGVGPLPDDQERRVLPE